ncbi:MAG: Fur family transcriptional regulator, ferric uptake regulator [Clostridiales bacterium]|jgi:Fur family ferric uptake transcriptional regulator|nr:Fur family transcriptional regulator, ferric uptake regulator [Clostridiales bacterium]RJR13014.1 MAG: transcriptional repressor [Candidatus Parcubacteria bacterium]
MQNTKVDLKQQLNDRGYRITPQRKAILDIFSMQVGKHLSCEELFKLVRENYPGIGLSTIYRTLPLLEKMGLLNKIILEDGFVRYELNNPQEQHLHHHLICIACGDISEVQEDMLEGLERQIHRNNRFIIKNHSVKFYGYCEKCSHKNSPN